MNKEGDFTTAGMRDARHPPSVGDAARRSDGGGGLPGPLGLGGQHGNGVEERIVLGQSFVGSSF